MMVSAFDCTKITACEKKEIKMLIRPFEVEVSFWVVDITIFSLLVDRPSTHTMGTIPSVLHRKVKFISENKVISVMPKGSPYGCFSHGTFH